jgi:hypothetical protein
MSYTACFIANSTSSHRHLLVCAPAQYDGKFFA